MLRDKLHTHAQQQNTKPDGPEAAPQDPNQLSPQELRAYVAQLEAHIEYLRNETVAMNDMFNTTVLVIEAERQANAALQKALSELRNDHLRLAEFFNDNQEVLEAARVEIQRLRTDNEALEARANSLEEQRNRLRATINTAMREMPRTLAAHYGLRREAGHD